MNALTSLIAQRGSGNMTLAVGRSGVAVLREEGSTKVRLPRGGTTAFLINTGGGLAGGDHFAVDVCVGPEARLTLTSQACERVYRTLGPEAVIDVRLAAGPRASLFWLPQEAILYDGSALARQFTIRLAPEAHFLAVEAVVFGRGEMGERPSAIRLRDRWRVYRDDRLVHADDLRIEGSPPAGRAGIGDAGALATVIAIGAKFEARLPQLRETVGRDGGASAFNGKVLARIPARDGLELRQRLRPALFALASGELPPNLWIG